VKIVDDLALGIADNDANENEVDADLKGGGSVAHFDFGFFGFLVGRRGSGSGCGWRRWRGLRFLCAKNGCARQEKRTGCAETNESFEKREMQDAPTFFRRLWLSDYRRQSAREHVQGGWPL